MSKKKEILVTLLPGCVYLLLSYRYLPDRLGASLYHTAVHLLTVTPFVAGMTIFFVAIVNRMSGERLSWNAVARIYLTFGIVLEFFYGLYDYLSKT